MRVVQFSAVALVIAAPLVSHAQADSATIDKIIDEGKNHSQVMAHLKYIAKTIGPRLTSSPNLDKAYKWTQQRFKDFGCKNVHLEQWGEWPVGFQRGKSSGAMISPEKVTFEFTTPSWSEGTHGKKKGFAVYAPTTMDEFKAMQSKLKGAWVIYKTTPPRAPRVQPGQTPPELTPEQKAAQELLAAVNGAEILGKVMPSRNELVLTSGSYRDKTFENHPMDVNITIRKSDMDKVMAHLDKSEPVQLEFDVNQRFVKGPRKMFNVVAEIPGQTDEVVIVGGHLDSWDGPGSEGAADNGTGTSVALETARILNKVGIKPKRTIRFILFTGEEQGLFGSVAYVEAHRAEWPKISAVLIEDEGANYESGTFALESMLPFLQPIIDVNNKTFPFMPSKLRTVAKMPLGGGSDHVPFNKVGIPGFFWDKAGTQDYGYIHHTQYDVYERVPSKYMVQCSVNQSVAAYTIAQAATMMPRDPSVTPPPAGAATGGR
jgi:hypothetical protein